MKKILMVLCMFVMTTMTSYAASDNDYAIAFEQLPGVSQTFIRTNFAAVQVTYCIKESHGFEAHLADATEVEFDYAGNWKEVDCKYKAVPESILKLVPASIPAHVKATFPAALVTKINVKMWGYEVKLNNGLELEFDKAGTFMRIDD